MKRINIGDHINFGVFLNSESVFTRTAEGQAKFVRRDAAPTTYRTGEGHDGCRCCHHGRVVSVWPEIMAVDVLTYKFNHRYRVYL